MANKRGKSGNNDRFYFGGTPKSLWMVTAAMKLKDACYLERKAMTNLNSILKKTDIILPAKVHMVKVMIFPVVMYRYRYRELDYKER